MSTAQWTATKSMPHRGWRRPVGARRRSRHHYFHAGRPPEVSNAPGGVQPRHACRRDAHIRGSMQTEGFTTTMSWGYRPPGGSSTPTADGGSITPRVALQPDVKGRGPDLHRVPQSSSVGVSVGLPSASGWWTFSTPHTSAGAVLRHRLSGVPARPAGELLLVRQPSRIAILSFT